MTFTPETMGPALGLDPRVAANPASYTGHYLKQVLAEQQNAARAASRGVIRRALGEPEQRLLR